MSFFMKSKDRLPDSRKKDWHAILGSLLCVPEEIAEVRKEVGMLRLGGRGRSVAEEVQVILNCDQITIQEELFGIISVELLDANKSAAERADVILKLSNESIIKLWLPQNNDRWLRQFRRLQLELTADTAPEMKRNASKCQFGAEATALSDEEIRCIIAETSSQEKNWIEAYDDVTQRPYFINPDTNETSWYDSTYEHNSNASLEKVQETKNALQSFVTTSETPPLVLKVLHTLKRFPTLNKDPDWLTLLEPKKAKKSLRGLLKTSVDDSLLDKLAYVLAELLHMIETTTVSIDAAHCVKTLIDCEDLRELPQVFIERIIQARRLILKKFAPFLRDAEFSTRLKKSILAIPRTSILSLASYGALPSSKTTARRIMHLFFSARLSPPSLVQRMAQFSLGIESAQAARDECLRRIGNPRLTRDILTYLSDAALEDERVLQAIFADDVVPVEASRAFALELYLRKAQAVVKSYGDPTYIDFVSMLYPTILCPLAVALQSSSLKGIKLLDSIFCALDTLTLIKTGDDAIFAQLRALDDAVGFVIAELLGLGHRAAIHTPGPCLQVFDWFRDLLEPNSSATPLGALFVPKPQLDMPCAYLSITTASVDLALFGYIRLDNSASSSSLPRVWGRPSFENDDDSSSKQQIADVTLALEATQASELIQTGWYVAGWLSRPSSLTLNSSKPVLLYHRSTSSASGTVSLKTDQSAPRSIWLLVIRML